MGAAPRQLWRRWIGTMSTAGSGIVPMSDMVSSQPHVSRPLLLAVTASGMLVAGTVALWAHYGSAVFFEMIAAGFAACF